MVEPRVCEAVEFLFNREKISISLGLSSYTLQEEEAEGKSILFLNIHTKDNVCVNNFDKVPKRKLLNWKIIRPEHQFQSEKCIDHFILIKNRAGDWELHMFEMKTTVHNDTWIDVKYKVRASYFDIKVFAILLGINVKDENIFVYTTYENEKFRNTQRPPLGQRVVDFKRDEWDKGCINIPLIFTNKDPLKFKTLLRFQHTKIKMYRADDGYLKNEKPFNI